MANTFIDELIEVNKRIPRRLVRTLNGFTTTTELPVTAQFVDTRILTSLFDTPEYYSDSQQVFYFQLGRDEFRGLRKITKPQARLALGHDFSPDDKDVSTMLRACERNDSNINAYSLGPNYPHTREGYFEVPVAYFHIPPEIHETMQLPESVARELTRKLR